MIYKRIEAPSSLACAIEYFWWVVNDSPIRICQKIIPDGCPELIFHFGDPFRIQLHEDWREQSRCLLAGQLMGPILLENTGKQEVFGIKFKPSVLSRWFSLAMNQFNHRVVDLEEVRSPMLQQLKEVIITENDMTARIRATEAFLLYHFSTGKNDAMEEALRIIEHFHGGLSIASLCNTLGIGERKLERWFIRHVGLSPKQYSRVIRFRYLFDWFESGKHSWVQVGLKAGYYDQSHFIREFKTFAGEEPSGYSFAEEQLGNFLARKMLNRSSDLYNTI